MGDDIDSCWSCLDELPQKMDDPVRLRIQYEIAVLQHQQNLVSMSPWEGEREEVIGGSGSDRGSVGDKSLACMTSYLWNSEMETRDLSRTTCGCLRDVRRATNQAGSEDHQAKYKLQRGPRPWSETCPHSAASCRWDQVSLNVLWVEGASQFHIPAHPKSVPGHHWWEQVWGDECPTTPEEWRAISDNFAERWNFPHTCGALDGNHVNCKCPPNSGSLYYNYKGFYSVVLVALVDADYKFIWADIGGMGSASDAQIYNASELKECVEDGSLGFPDP